LEDPGVDGRIILKWIFEKWAVGLELIDLVLGKGRWLALSSATMNLRVP
jgi:hypothetical protein